MPKVKVLPLPSIRPILPRDIIRHDASGSKPSHSPREVKVPFFKDPDHTIPTKALYRRLIRGTRIPSASPLLSEKQEYFSAASIDTEIDWSALRRKVREDWKKRRGWTSILQTRGFLDTQHDFLSTLSTSSTRTDPSSLASLSRDLSSRQRRADLRAIPPPTRKPYLAGFLRPTHNNPPLPRLKPQPIQITLTILSRIKARARRLDLQRALYAQEAEMQQETNFFRNEHLRRGKESLAELEDVKGYLGGYGTMKDAVQGGYDRDERRRRGVFGLGVVRRVEEGKRRRQAWKRVKAEERRAGT